MKRDVTGLIAVDGIGREDKTSFLTKESVHSSSRLQPQRSGAAPRTRSHGRRLDHLLGDKKPLPIKHSNGRDIAGGASLR